MSESTNGSPQTNSSAETVKITIEDSSNSGVLLFLKVLEYLSLAAAIGFSITVFFLPEYLPLRIGVAVSVSAFIFLLLVNRQFGSYYTNRSKQLLLSNKALLRNIALSKGQEDRLTPLVEKALGYSQDLIDDYKRVRRSARNIYYILQLGTVVLYGVTPILVLVDKLETSDSWLKWLPVICPAAASIIASVATSFAFQEKWTTANKVVELLEAEQEKFVLGAGPVYQDYDLTEAGDREKGLKMAIANYISKVNSIHLKQIGDAPESVKEKKADSSESGKKKEAAAT
ncbi:MAG: DUF4231 domain-containing protein [Okeania sp. SIO2H7]|nr:DUF4231 domain-containing protein [Okeania sp. SIO2H7]